MPHIMSFIARLAALTGMAGVLLLSPPGAQSLVSSAAAQEVAVSGEFHTALDPYGTWRHNRRFGDVWIPANLARDWRPYTVGHWVYTDDYGWYWVADDQEADWGWITYHYGRWYLDPDEGWVWIPNNVWGPAWVAWRYGDDYCGWAAEPPDEYVVTVEDNPTYWNFVSASDLIAPTITAVLLPFQRREEFFRRTVVVNRPVQVRRSGQLFAVNPGIAPAHIAAIRGRPLPTFNVRPRVLAGTNAVPGAIQVRAADLRRQRELGNRPGTRERVATRALIRPSSTVIRPARTAQPQPLARGEAGRLGQAQLRAARGATVAQGAAERVPRTPSAQQQGGEQRQTAAPQRGREAEQRQSEQHRGNIAPPSGEPRGTARAPAGPRPGTAEQRASERGRNQLPTAAERRQSERTPVARGPVRNPGLVERGPAARPQVNRPPAVAARPSVNRPPPVVARPQAPAFNRPPPVAARPQAPAFNRPPPVAVRPQAPAINRPPPVAAAPRPAPPPPAAARPAPPATMGAAPRGGPIPGQRRQ